MNMSLMKEAEKVKKDGGFVTGKMLPDKNQALVTCRGSASVVGVVARSHSLSQGWTQVPFSPENRQR